MDDGIITEAAKLLLAGELVAFPTETVYGLGAPIFNEQGVAKIYAVKGRPSDNPLIAHIADLKDVERIAREIPDDFYVLASHFFPGPLTVVLKKHPLVPPMVSAGLDTIALRMPSHPLALALIKAVGEPLVAPSANLSGRPSSTKAQHVLEDFEGKIGGVIDGGESVFGIESTVISLIDAPTLLRPGVIPEEEIEKVLGKKLQRASAGAQGSPGMRHRHYAPRGNMRLAFSEDEIGPAERVFSRTSSSYPLSAHTLYDLLRQADREGVQEIVVYCDEEIQKDEGLMDRLRRASEDKRSHHP
ncbi:MAG: threonylcarbamoyl-AMP synthase [Verrucomicrobia bacterium]|nr:threonylcarbamoyl-AMP synthase [Verrucomicrobiota bacterium]